MENPALLISFKKKRIISQVALIGWFMLCINTARAQIDDKIFLQATAIDSANTGNLSLSFNSLNFFKNNEYNRAYTSGYTLPGANLTTLLTYQPMRNATISLGAYFIRYWGAETYPTMAYRDIPQWKGKQFSKGAHIVPMLRGQLQLSDRLDVVLGSIYGKSNHRLIEPLYNPELNMMADPETGLQFIYLSPYLDFDTWVNWESFIFRNDVHNESFIFGFSGKIKLNPANQKLHFFVPIQMLAHHRGGEIDTITQKSAFSSFNMGLGVGANLQGKLPLTLAVYGLTYSQSKGYDVFSFDKGWALYAVATTTYQHFKMQAAYWYCNRFISLLGSPFFSAGDLHDNKIRYERSQLAQLSGAYQLYENDDLCFGASVDTYWGFAKRAGFSFGTGVYLRINPHFVLKHFK